MLDSMFYFHFQWHSTWLKHCMWTKCNHSHPHVSRSQTVSTAQEISTQYLFQISKILQRHRIWICASLSNKGRSSWGWICKAYREKRNGGDTVTINICAHKHRKRPDLREFKEGAYRQSGLKRETVKNTKSAGSLSSLEMMGGKKERNSTTTASKCTKYSSNQPLKRQSNSYKECQCPSKIAIFMWPNDQCYYLDSNQTCLNHVGHSYIQQSDTTKKHRNFQTIPLNWSKSYLQSVSLLRKLVKYSKSWTNLIHPIKAKL